LCTRPARLVFALRCARELLCAVTRRADVFQLGAVMQDTKTLVTVSAAAASSYCPSYQWHPFVWRDDAGFFCRLAEWLVPGGDTAVTCASVLPQCASTSVTGSRKAAACALLTS
jgi:hypothetical protein